MYTCLAVLVCTAAAAGTGMASLYDDSPSARLTRAKAIRKEAEDRLKALDNTAPALDDPWSSTRQSEEVMQDKSQARAAFDAAEAAVKTATEQEADDLAKSVPPEETTMAKVKAELRPAIDKPTYRSVPYQINAAEYSGSTDPKMPKAELDAVKFSQELKRADSTEQKSLPMDVSDAAGPDDTTTSSSYMQSYDETMREIKLKSLQKAARTRSLDRATTLKAQAVSDEKKSELGAEKEKVKYLKAKVREAQKALDAAKQNEGSGQLDPKVAGELVAEEEDNLKQATLKLNKELSSLRQMQVSAKEHDGSEAHIDGDMKAQQKLKQLGIKAYQKRVAIQFVQGEFERRQKNIKNQHIFTAEKLRKGERRTTIEVQRREENEAKAQTEANKKIGKQEAVLKESQEGGCKVSPWSSYSRCSRQCGGGYKTSMRTVVSFTNQKDCPSLAKGRPCNEQPCPQKEGYTGDGNTQVTKTNAAGQKVLTTLAKEQSSTKGGCEPAISKCATARARAQICGNYEDVKAEEEQKSPTVTQMIKATEFSKPVPHMEDETEDMHIAPEDPHSLAGNLPSSSDQVQEIGEDQSSTSNRVQKKSKAARSLLVHDPNTDDTCRQAHADVKMHCKDADACANRLEKQPNEVGESNAADNDDRLAPNDEGFDSELVQLLRGVDHLRKLPV